MKTLDEVIKGLNCCKHESPAVCEECPYYYNCGRGHDDCFCRLENDELHYLEQLKSLADNPPLTWEELAKMEGEPVWFESKTEPEVSRWHIVDEIEVGTGWDDDDDGTREYLRLQNQLTSTIISKPRDGKLYGKHWNAYRRKPDHFVGVNKMEDK